MVFNKRNPIATKKRSLLSYTNPFSPIAEQYRSTRTNLYFLTKKSEKKVLLITSPKKGDGKTTTIVNLAVSMARGKEKVLLVDANFRDPSIHSIFKVPNHTGLVNVIKSIDSFKDVVHHSYISGLDLLTSGNTRIGTLEDLGTNEMTDLLQEAWNKYDTILIDGPSVLEAAETRFLASKSDGVILLANRYHTKIEDIEKAKKSLEVAKAHIVGVILNEKSKAFIEEYFF